MRPDMCTVSNTSLKLEQDTALSSSRVIDIQIQSCHMRHAPTLELDSSCQRKYLDA